MTKLCRHEWLIKPEYNERVCQKCATIETMNDQTAADDLLELFRRNPELAGLNPDLSDGFASEELLLSGDFATEEDLLNAQGRARAIVMAKGYKKGKGPARGGEVCDLPDPERPEQDCRRQLPCSVHDPNRRALAGAMSEAELQANVIAMAQAFGWIIYHHLPARTGRTYIGKDGGEREIWNTPGQGQPGFPDLILARDRILYRELKAERGQLSPNQELWRDVIQAAGGDWDLWQPSHWLSGKIEEVLRCAST